MESISRFQTAFIGFGCGDAETLIVIPAAECVGWLDRFWIAHKTDSMYWHVRIAAEHSRFTIDTTAGNQRLDVTQYFLK